MKIAILGHGVVGSGTREILEERGFTVKKILEKREIPEIKDRITDDFDEIISDEEIKIVVETIGGLEPAHTFAVKTLKAKKHFVTSNKFLMSEYFGELVSLAEENGVSVRFGASAGGGIPWIHNLSRCAKTDEITEICGIMNGTTNYILDAMERKGISFSDALKTAQSLGYAERDPSADVDGYDVARKVALSVAAGFGKIIKTEDIPTFSLKAVSLKDMAYIKEKTGRSIRYKGFAKDLIGGVSAFVEPTLVKAESLESRVSEM
ncbi:MAG TPA: hypothetical protein DDW54_01385 [Clostridiales bacterium]|nr:hypothetical protein [Clostridiales bacterium]